MVMTTKWNNEYFAGIGLIPSYWYYYHKIYCFSLISYIQRMKEKQRVKHTRRIQRAEGKGQEYYTPTVSVKCITPKEFKHWLLFVTHW